MKCSFVALMVFLVGCASTPMQTTDACSVLDQKGGIFSNWQHKAKRAEQNYGIPMPIILATMYVESGFKQRARPQRKKLLGFIPWKRASTAYGYPQAINSTWNEYRIKTGNRTARRTSFDDSAQFIAWFHRESIRKNGVLPNDAYSLYLNYYMGHRAYVRATRSTIAIQGAQKMQTIAQRYETQLRNCGLR